MTSYEVQKLAHRKPVGDIVEARDAREMRTIQGKRVAKCKRNGAEASSAEQIMIEYK